MTSKKATLRPIFCKESQASELFALSYHYFKEWREQGLLIEGKHYVRLSERKLLYHVDEMETFLKEKTLGNVGSLK
jgi:hypothetical protein